MLAVGTVKPELSQSIVTAFPATLVMTNAEMTFFVPAVSGVIAVPPRLAENLNVFVVKPVART
jgi:hypothetical protein